MSQSVVCESAGITFSCVDITTSTSFICSSALRLVLRIEYMLIDLHIEFICHIDV